MKDKLLVIPGHLGKDPGAVGKPSGDVVGDFGSPTYEKECWINLQQAIGFCIAWAASDICTRVQVTLCVPNGEVKPGLIDVIDVKDPNKFTLRERALLANRLDADVLEIHNNSSADETARGCEVCIFRYSHCGKLTEGAIAGQFMLDELKKLGIKSRGLSERPDLYMLRRTRNLALVSEAGFVSNPGELGSLDVDLDSFNDQVGLAMWLGYSRAYKSLKLGINIKPSDGYGDIR